VRIKGSKEILTQGYARFTTISSEGKWDGSVTRVRPEKRGQFRKVREGDKKFNRDID